MAAMSGPTEARGNWSSGDGAEIRSEDEGMEGPVAVTVESRDPSEDAIQPQPD